MAWQCIRETRKSGGGFFPAGIIMPQQWIMRNKELQSVVFSQVEL